MKNRITSLTRNILPVGRHIVAKALLLILLPLGVSSQYNTLKVYKPYTVGKHQPLELVQIDFRENSTLVHFTLTNPSSLESNFFIDRGFTLVDKETNQHYRLLNSYNIPLDNANEFAQLADYGDKLNFTLEFEKVRDSLAYLDLVEKADDEGAFNIHEIVIYKDQASDTFMDMDEFLGETPLKTTRYFYHEGEIVQFLDDPSGLTVAANIELVKSYGKYFRINFSIQNLTGRPITVFPEEITAEVISKLGENQRKEAKVLTHDQYMKKVKNRQTWNSIALGVSSGLAASTAGYSNSTTYSTNYDYSGYSPSYSSSTHYTTTYDASAAYAAQQNAVNTMANFENEQYEIKNTLSDGYLKRNTISNETEYVGYIKIPYSRKIKGLKVIFPINGREYTFVF